MKIRFEVRKIFTIQHENVKKGNKRRNLIGNSPGQNGPCRNAIPGGRRSAMRRGIIKYWRDFSLVKPPQIMKIFC